jgi:uncharacterized protein YcbX
MSRIYKDVAIVRELRRYPVKSMAGSEVSETKLSWHGLVGDRRYGFVRARNQSGLPFLSAREAPWLLLYQAEHTDPANPDHSSIQVKTPDGSIVALNSPELIAELEQRAGLQLYLQQLWRGCFDSMDVSLITLDSIRTISDQVGLCLETTRFRPNLVLEAIEPKAFPEEAWVGETLRVGNRDDSAWIRMDRRDQRCVVVNLDPATAVSNPEVMVKIATSRKNNLGVYGSAIRPGTMRTGDVVSMVS